MAGFPKGAFDNLTIESNYLPNEDLTVFRLSGSIDSHTYEEFESELEQVFNKGRFRIVVDMEMVRYISSAGTGVIIGALARTRDSGGDVVIINLTEAVANVLDVLGLTPMLSIASSPEMLMTFFSQNQ